MAPSRSSSAAIKHFSSIEWINKAYLQDSQYEIPDFANTYQESSTEKGYDGFFGQTLHSETTIPYLLHLARKDLFLPPLLSSGIVDRSSKTPTAPPDLVLLVTLGPAGLDGWPGLAHGGLVCSLLDNVMGHAITSFRKLLPEAEKEVPMYTGKIEVKFLAPVKTGRKDIVLLSWLTSRTEKKWNLKAQIQNRDGKVLAEGETLWVVANQAKL